LDQEPYPDFVAMAKSFKCGARRITEKGDVDEALNELIDSDGPFVLDVMVPYQNTSCRYPAGGTVREIIKA